MRASMRFLFAQAFGAQLFGLYLEVRSDLLGKIFCTSPATEHGLHLLTTGLED